MKQDFYEVLGLPKGADENAIKKAFRQLAKRYHPDMNPGDKQAEKKFQEINEAYAVLSDPEKKRIYDKCGMAAFENGMDPKKYEEAYDAYGGRSDFGSGNAGDFFRNFTGGNGGSTYSYRSYGPDGKSYQSFHFNGDDADDIFGQMFGNMFHGKSGHTGHSYSTGGSGFGGFGGSSGFYNGAEQAAADYDIHSELTIGFMDAINGCTRKVQLSSANGHVSTLEIRIPAGIEDGKSIRLRGKGNRRPNGGSGDLIIQVHVQAMPGFERKGRDLYTTARIPYTTAVFGGEAELPVLNGHVVCRIPKGTQSGSKMRLRGKGVKDMKGVCGDEYVTIEIAVPKTLTREEQESLKAYQTAEQHRHGSRASN
ncbi:MAG: DnaJ C-terminal domain-containing protein [Bilifractor sp.]